MAYIFGQGPKGKSSGNLFDLGVSYAPTHKRKKLSASEILQLQAAKKAGKHTSLWGQIKGATAHSLHPVLWTMDQIMRPLHGIAEAERRVGAYEHAITSTPKFKHAGWFEQEKMLFSHPGHQASLLAHGFAAGVSNHKRTGFGQAIEARGYLKGHRHLRGLAGFGLDVAADPLTYVTGGTTILARSGEHAAAIAGGRRAIHGATHDYFTHTGKLDEAIAKNEQDVVALSKMDKASGGYRYRHALSKMNLRELRAAKEGKALPSSFHPRYRIIAEQALAEEKRVEKFVPHYGIKGKKILPGIAGRAEKIGGKEVAQGRQLLPALPKLDNFIAKTPIGKGAAEAFRNSVVRAKSLTPETKQLEITAKHISEEATAHHFNFATMRLEGLAKGIDAARQRQVLHYFEKPVVKRMRAVIKMKDANGDLIHTVNPKYINHLVKKGLISAKEADFVHGYQQVVEQMFHAERAAGSTVTHFADAADTKGRMYVPHLMSNEGVAANDAMKKLTTKAGFERARSDRAFSLHELVKMAREGDIPKGVIADPYELLVARIRASGRRQGELHALGAAVDAAGVQTVKVNEKKLAATRQALKTKTAARKAKADEHTNIMSKAITDHEAAVEAAEKKVRSIRYGRKPSKTKAMNLANAVNRLEKLKKRGPKLGLAMERHTELKALDKELKGLAKQEKDILKGTKHPDYRTNMHTVDILDKHGNKMALPEELGEAVSKVRRVIEGDDATIKGFEAGWRKVQSRWKTLVTSINPGYRMRNSQTDAWNWWLTPGVSTGAMTKYATKAAKWQVRMKNIERKIAETGMTPQIRADLKLYHDMYHHGILSGLYQGDVQTAAEMLRLGHSKSALLKKARLLRFTEKAAQDMNRNGENWLRVAHYMWARESKGLSSVEAALSVKAAHFDYEDLTPFEQRRLKAVMPFYTWTRKNIPYQIKSFFRSPGKYAAFPKAAMEAEYSAGDQKGQLVPGFISGAWGIPVGGGNYVLPQLGVSDLQAIDTPHGAEARALSLLTPGVKLPLELATNKNLFTGGPIASDTHSRNPVSPIGASLLQFLPGSNVGQTSRVGPGGKHLYGPGANPYLLHALGYLGPTANLILKKSGGIGKRQADVSPLWSYGAGVSVQHVDQAQERLMEQIVNNKAAQKMMQDLRDEGILPQAKRRKGKKARQFNADILKLQARGG